MFKFSRGSHIALRAGGLALLLSTLACQRSSGVSVVHETPAPAPTPQAPDVTSLPSGDPVVATLTSPPHVPPPTNRTKPARVIVKLDVKELVMPMSDGVEYTYWTFGGTVPGSFIRVRQGDIVEFHLQNDKTSKMPHNIDLHAVSGPGGGAEASFTAPGHVSQFSFRALNPGLFVYHCATAPVPLHVANGMYGMILVEPPDGMPFVDREYYVMQGDFYTKGAYRAKGLQPFDMQKGIDAKPTYVVFNGREGSLLGDKALKAHAGETVRIYFGSGGPNLTSSFHVIGEIFDRVYSEGGARFQENVQTTMVPAGGSTIVEFRVDVPGNYPLVDHSLFRAFNQGAVGMLAVSGSENKFVYSGKQKDYAATAELTPTPDTGLVQEAVLTSLTLEEQIAAGKTAYATNCASCHQASGAGLQGSIPPLAASDFLTKNDEDRLISVVLNGLSGPIKVNGAMFDSVMPPWNHLSNDDVANVLTYVLNTWGNPGGSVSPADVTRVRRGAM